MSAFPDPEFHTDGNSVWVIFRYTRKTVGHDPTITRQLPHSHPTVTPQVEKVLSAIGTQTLSTKEIMCVIGLKDKSNFLELYLYPAIRQNLVEPIYPENPKHPRQKYRLTDKRKRTVDIITGVWWRKKKKQQGHYCRICSEYKANEQFSGKGHSRHICKECRSLPDDVKADMVRCNEVERAVFKCR